MVTFPLHGTNLVHVLLLTWTCSSSIKFRYNSVLNFSVANICMGGFPLQIYCCNMIPLGRQSSQEQHSQHVIQEGYAICREACVVGVEAADFSCWVLRSTEAELGDLLKVSE